VPTDRPSHLLAGDHRPGGAPSKTGSRQETLPPRKHLVQARFSATARTCSPPLPISSLRVRHDRTERSAAADRTDATLATEPTENADRNDPTEAIERTDPTEAIDRIDPLEPTDKIELCDLIESQELSGVLTWPIMTIIGCGRQRLGGVVAIARRRTVQPDADTPARGFVVPAGPMPQRCTRCSAGLVPVMQRSRRYRAAPAGGPPVVRPVR
jgi:hypothetical protein